MARLSNAELLQKATLNISSSPDAADFGGPGQAPLTIEQVRTFLRLAITPQVILPDVRTVMANANKWQESKIDFASRVLKPGVEATRLADADRAVPTTGVVEISTVLLRGEVPVSDEVLEDQVEQEGFADTLMAMIAEAVGRDIEELMLNGDTTSGDPYLALLDGWIKQATTGAGNNTYDASADGQDYQAIFSKMLSALPDKYKRDKANMRFYVPQRLEEKYRDTLAARGTPLGDMMLQGGTQLMYQEIPIKGVPLQAVTPGTPDRSTILLTHRMNLYAGFRRQVRMEKWRDPREGATSFVVSTRVDAKVAHVPATVVAKNVDVEP